MELDTSDMDISYSKPIGKRGERKRRSGVKQFPSSIKKTVNFPQHVLGKRMKTLTRRIESDCADDLNMEVEYSLNKKNRWKNDFVQELLQNEEEDDIHVQVVEEAIPNRPCWCAYYKSEKVKTIYSRDAEGSTQTRQLRGRGVTVESLEDYNRKIHEERKACLEYRLMYPHLIHKITYDQLRESYKRPRREKRVNIDDLEMLQLDQDPDSDPEDTTKDSPGKRPCFSLGDYITEQPVIVKRLRPTRERKTTEVVREKNSPPDVLDLSAVLGAPCTHDLISVETTNWNDFNFHQQIEQLFSDSSLVVRWLDVNHQRASVDLTAKLPIHNSEKASELIVVLEKSNKSSFRFIMNASAPLSTKHSLRLLKTDLDTEAKCVSDVLRVTTFHMQKWRRRHQNICKKGVSAVNHPRKYDSRVNCWSMANKATVVTERQMESLLRDYGHLSYEENFEEFADNESLSESSSLEFETNIHPSVSKTCASCLASVVEDLFELDDCWMCRECLRHQIIKEIKTKNIPLEISFMMDVGGSTYDVLPALIPLPVLHLYTKIVAYALLQADCSETVPELLDCPCCKETVQVHLPIQYSSCMCSGCAAVWCSDCKLEPHWPMNCQQKKEWSGKWNKQYPGGIDRDDDCEPGPDSSSRFIKKTYSEPCFAARSARFSQKRTSEIEKNCGKARKLVVNAGKVPELRRSILCLVEFGLARLYLTKGGHPGLKASLLQLHRQCDRIVDEIGSPKPTTADCVVFLENLLEKVMDRFRKVV